MHPFVEIPVQDGKIAVSVFDITRLEESKFDTGTTVHLQGARDETIHSTLSMKQLMLKIRSARHRDMEGIPANVVVTGRKTARKK